MRIESPPAPPPPFWRELDPKATIRKFRIVRREGTREVTRLIDHSNLEAILAVGYRVRSPRSVQFRRWVTTRLHLHEEEISELNRIVVMWLDYAEDQAKRRKQVFLRDWESKLNDFLAFNERRVLPNAGRTSKEEADTRAGAEYEEFAARRRAYLEAEAESSAFRSLEEQAEQVSPRIGRTPRKRPL